MSEIQQVSHSELIEEIEPFFAPMSADLVDSLIGQYNAARANVEALAAAVRAGHPGRVPHQAEAREEDQGLRAVRSAVAFRRARLAGRHEACVAQA